MFVLSFVCFLDSFDDRFLILFSKKIGVWCFNLHFLKLKTEQMVGIAPKIHTHSFNTAVLLCISVIAVQRVYSPCCFLAFGQKSNNLL